MVVQSASENLLSNNAPELNDVVQLFGVQWLPELTKVHSLSVDAVIGVPEPTHVLFVT